MPEHAVGGFQVEAINQQAPEPVALAEVDGPVHGLHAARRQPGPARVEKRVGRRLVVDALKEAQPASGQVGIGHGRGIAVEKCRQATNYCAGGVRQHPPNGFAVRKIQVFGGVEHRFYLGRQRADVRGLPAVQPRGQVLKQLHQAGINNFEKRHNKGEGQPRTPSNYAAGTALCVCKETSSALPA